LLVAIRNQAYLPVMETNAAAVRRAIAAVVAGKLAHSSCATTPARGAPILTRSQEPMATRKISLRHLRCFVAVAETGSFTLAAGRLFQTQSALTATIQQLETSVGLRLFDRTTRRVEMTDDATRFKVVADKIIRDFDSAIGDLQAVAKSQRGHLRIAAAPSVMTHILAPTL